MNDPLQIRADAILEAYVGSLSPNLYSFNKPSPEEGLYFAICRKGHNGQHWGRLRAMTLYEYRMLVSTSATDQEARSRLDAYIMEGKGTFRAPEPLPSVPIDQVQAIVRAAVEQALAAQRTSATAIPLHTASPEASLAPQSHGPQVPQFTPQPVAAKSPEDVLLWTARAAELGMKPPIMTKGGTINGNWLARAKANWEHKLFIANLDKQPVPTA